MSQHGSPGFQSYSRNLRRLFWVEFIDAQMAAADKANSKASILATEQRLRSSPAASLDHHRLLTLSGAE